MSAKITLARWNDQHGISVGWWLVREVPGLCVHRSHPDLGWCIAPIRLSKGNHGNDLSNYLSEARRVWGRVPDSSEAEAWIKEHQVHTAGFPTRYAARQELERTLKPQGSSLSQILSF